MNPDQPSREQIETRLTALLLGELPAEEAALLRYTIAQDPELQQLHDELQATLVLVREVAKHPADAPEEKNAPLQLSAERRQKLLAHFKTPRAKAKPVSFWLKPIGGPSLIPVLALVAIMVILASLLLPALSGAKHPSRRGTYGSVSPLDSLRERIWSADNDRREPMPTSTAQPQPAAAVPVANSEPAIITVASEPPLAAPPLTLPGTQVVLPQTESTSEPAAAAEVAKAGVYSQQVVGYVNIPNTVSEDLPTGPTAPAPVAAPPPAAAADQFALNDHIDTQERLERVEKNWILPGQTHHASGSIGGNSAGNNKNGAVVGIVNAFAGAGGFRSAGVGGGGWGGTPPPMTAGSASLSDSATPPNMGGIPSVVTRSIAPAQQTSERPLTQEMERPKANGNYEGFFAPRTASGETSGSVNNGALGAADSTFYREPTPEAVQKKLPASDGVPALGNSADVSFSLNPNRHYSGLTDNSGVKSDAVNGDLNVGLAENDTDKLRYLTQTEPSPSSSSPASGNRSPFVGRYAYAAPGFSLDHLQAINAIALNDGQQNPTDSGLAVMEIPAIDPNTGLPPVEATAKDLEKFVATQSYAEAKRDLEQKIKEHELLYAKLEAEKLDVNLPKNSLVQLTDPAQPGQSQSAWQSLTGQVESKARIKVENDVTDIQGMSGNPSYIAFDPYFIQTTFEMMQSEAVLGKVVDALNLESAWANKSGGEKLERSEAIAELKQRLDLHVVPNTKLIEIGAKSKDPKEAADIANAVAKAYADYRSESRRQLTDTGIRTLELQLARQKEEIQIAQAEVDRLGTKSTSEAVAEPTDVPLRKPAPNAPVPQPEILTRENAFSTFSLNVSDVSFKFAEASLQNGKLPDTASIRSEEFINAFDYRDPEAAAGQPMAFASERARYPFAHHRELLRFAVKTAAAGRAPGRALNLVLLLDNSGSMERADRVAIIREALRVLATQLQPQDTVSVVTFSRTARLWADGVSGDKAGDTLDKVGGITPEGGTNLEEAMRLAYATAHRHYLANGINRVVLLTDGAANLGNVEPNALKQKVETQRKQGIALDCFGIGWEDYNDDLLEQLASNGDGRYAFLNSPEDVARDFAAKLAGALQIAAADVKVQVEFNPQRVIAYRQIGYATHQLTKEQFRDNTVAAGQIAAQEAGNALYTIETNPNGDGPIATVHVRYQVPGTSEYREHSWDVAYDGNAPALDQSSPAMRLAATASAFSEWLAASPYAQEVTLDELLKYLSGVPEIYGADDRPKQLETMIHEAKSLEGK
jgi:Mg-chelatase subunit ChlD/anti-sigma factor RsiW